MSILITGGAGYIGSHTLVELLNRGEEVIVFDNFANSDPKVLEMVKQITGKDFKFYKCDMLDKDALNKIFEENKIDAVIHFAGLKAVGESVELPLEYYKVNIGGTINICEAMKNNGCSRMVFSSSATVYGMNNEAPFTEDMPLSTTNPYGSTKLMIENILRDISAADPSWSVALLRYFNPIGAHESGLIGESPNGIPNNLLPYVARVATGKLPQLSVYGDDYDTVDGTGVRDYIHVVDLALGHLKAVDYVMGNKGCNAFNLGTGRGSSVLEVVHAFERASGRKVAYTIAPRRPGDIATSYADCSKAKKLLGWEAKFDMDKMCSDMWNFAKNQ